MVILRAFLVFILVCSPAYAFELSDGSGKLLRSIIPCGTEIGDVVCIEDDGSGNPSLGFSIVTEQAADPTSASNQGMYCATGSGGCFYRSLTGLYNIAAGVYTVDEVPHDFTLTITDTSSSVFTVDGVTATAADSPKTWTGLTGSAVAISFTPNTTETVACTGTGVPTDFSGTVDMTSGDVTGACTVSATSGTEIGYTTIGGTTATGRGRRNEVTIGDSDFDVSHGYVYLANSSGSAANISMSIYTDAGVQVGTCSSSVEIPATATPAWYEVTWSSAITLSASTAYHYQFNTDDGSDVDYYYDITGTGSGYANNVADRCGDYQSTTSTRMATQSIADGSVTH